MAATRKLVKGKLVKIKPELEIDYFSSTEPEVYRLPTTTALRKTKRIHEELCSDLYVAFHLTGKMTFWDAPTEGVLIPDRRMFYDGKRIFWEVDRGNESYKKDIKGKIEKYIEMSNQDRNTRFHVCFTTIDAEGRQTALARMKAILNLIAEYKRGDQFLVAFQYGAVNYPEGASYLSPINLAGVSFFDAL